ncbi:MAG: S8 family serine peptidase [Thermoproteota archaeon]|nr:S8 family serine peptidase [Thermoproteota archaeon]
MTRRNTVVASLTLVVLLVLSGGALAAKPPKGGTTSKTPPPQRDFAEAPTSHTQSEYYTVTFADPPAASYTGGIPGLERTKPQPGQKLNPNAAAVRKYADYLKGVHDNFRGWLSSRAPGAEVVREHFLVGNSLVYKLNGAAPSLLAQGPNAKAAAASWLYRPTMTISNDLIGAPALWSGLGGREAAGAGISVGIIDTGIDESHPAFACKGDITNKVYASGGDPPPFGLPTIVFDHGTHVAGTVAGCVIPSVASGGAAIAGTWSGVAPGSTLVDYNVFPGFGSGFIAFGGSAFSHDICQAVEDGVADQMDVLNMSLGGGVQGPHDFLAECVNAANDAGVVVAVAAGNTGPGDSTVESPGSAAGALTAGASTNPHFVGIPVAVGTSTFGAALGDFNNFGIVTAPYTVTSPANGCTAISTALSGKIALIDRGVCSFSTKIRNAEAAGAIGVLVVNNVAGDPSAMAHDGLTFPTIPAAMLGKSDGNSIKPSGTLTVDGTSPREFITQNKDIVAGFSSRGPTPFTYLIKPDVAAPGVNILSSVFNGEYAFFQGTSMATPHVAGSAALLLDAHPGWSPADVKSALVNTGARVVTDHENAAVDPGVLARGGGRVALAAATVTPVTFDPASVSFGKWTGSKAVSASVSVTAKNVSGSAQMCAVSVAGSPFVSVSPTATSIAAGGTATISATLNGGRTIASGDHSGDITVTCGSTSLKVPWWTRVSTP